ncbi:hypothetical protein NDU88_001810 [Pleurodeles waltl]|uniref:Uncharacterized protein n=1 Tax=Pleurodeles waltl TaxID=8319 RepID=A0AAV7KTU5_PLEWA|nr:hypothetical protein NDU88_001810 [Pleurodeles waltl]
MHHTRPIAGASARIRPCTSHKPVIPLPALSCIVPSGRRQRRAPGPELGNLRGPHGPSAPAHCSPPGSGVLRGSPRSSSGRSCQRPAAMFSVPAWGASEGPLTTRQALPGRVPETRRCFSLSYSGCPPGVTPIISVHRTSDCEAVHSFWAGLYQIVCPGRRSLT